MKRKISKCDDDGLAAAAASVGLTLEDAPVCKRPGIVTDLSEPGLLSPRGGKRLADALTAAYEAELGKQP